LVVVAGGLIWRMRAPRTDRVRAALVLWGGWLLVSGLVFSLGSGVIHTYYTVALAPAIAALVAIGAAVLWTRRERLAARGLLASGVLITAGWSIVLLGRTPSWQPWLIPLVASTAMLSVAGLLAYRRRLQAMIVPLALVACLAGPVAYSAQTIGAVHTGSVPSAGPTSIRAGGNLSAGPASIRAGANPLAGTRAGAAIAGAAAGGGASASRTSSALIDALKAGSSGYRWVAATSGSQNAATLELGTGGLAVMGIGGFNNQGGNLSLAQFEAYVKAGEIHYYVVSGAGAGGGAPSSAGASQAVAPGDGAIEGHGQPGGGSTTPSGGSTTPSGGSTTPSGGSTTSSGGSSTSAISSWVKAHYRAETIGGQTVYDLSKPVSS
jgi:hypothetical protein